MNNKQYYQALTKHVIKHDVEINSDIKYSIICPIYNVDKYLNDFIISLINQTLNFEHNIELVLVNDGSLDNSAQICNSWLARYPNNIKYIEQVNQGLSAARNTGILHASNEWLIFCDPDDFLNPNFFATISQNLAIHPDVDCIINRLVFFYEKQCKFSDTHYINNQLPQDNTVVSFSKDSHYYFCSVSCNLIRKSILLREKLFFNSKVKPSAEDCFLANYYIYYSNKKVLLLPNNHYYYRRRSNKSSLVDSALNHPERYNKMILSYLITLKFYHLNLDYIPKWTKISILNNITWVINDVVARLRKIPVLKEDQKLQEKFFNLCVRIFQYYDVNDIIARSNIQVALRPFFEIGLCKIFKQQEVDVNYCIIKGINYKTKSLEIEFGSNSKNIDFKIKQNDIALTISSHIISEMKFLDRSFVYKHCFAIALKNIKTKSQIICCVDNKVLTMQDASFSVNYKISNDIILKAIHNTKTKYRPLKVLYKKYLLSKFL